MGSRDEGEREVFLRGGGKAAVWEKGTEKLKRSGVLCSAQRVGEPAMDTCGQRGRLLPSGPGQSLGGTQGDRQ